MSCLALRMKERSGGTLLATHDLAGLVILVFLLLFLFFLLVLPSSACIVYALAAKVHKHESLNVSKVSDHGA